MDASSPCELQGTENSEDRLSQMPDEILANILSPLSVKEVGRSSVLSKRWQNLWKLTNRLDFDSPKALDEVQSTRCPGIVLGPERSKYVTWVNEVLNLHERPFLEEFRVQFDLDASASKDIDEWIKFAISKRAEKLSIDLKSCFKTDEYTPSQECLHYVKSVSSLPKIMCIKSLSLGQVNVAGELVEYLLSKCPQLEMLSLSLCNHLGKLRVASPALPLKYLNVYICKSLDCIELSAPKLETFIFHGAIVNFVIGNNPRLSNLSIGGTHPHNVVGNCFGQFSSQFSQLETLYLRMRFKVDSDLPEVGKLTNLKHLNLNINAVCDQCDESLIGFNRFIMAAPSLSKLTMKVSVLLPLDFLRDSNFILNKRGTTLSLQPHESLKEVEIFGYDGCSYLFEFASYFAKISINLEKMVLEPVVSKNRKEIELQEKKVRGQANILKGSLPSRAKLIVSV